jgi:ATP citrate (pro-S)-lyase
MPSAAPVDENVPSQAATSTGDGLSANDNIRRFAAPSRPMSPPAAHTLFHPKTRCFV